LQLDRIFTSVAASDASRNLKFRIIFLPRIAMRSKIAKNARQQISAANFQTLLKGRSVGFVGRYPPKITITPPDYLVGWRKKQSPLVSRSQHLCNATQAKIVATPM